MQLLVLLVSVLGCLAQTTTPPPAPPTPTQFPVLPNPALVSSLPQLDSSFLVFIAGGRGIALATALQYAALGAHVTITTRNIQTYDLSQIANTNINLVELHYGERSRGGARAFRVAQKYLDQHGRRPDVLVQSALTIYNGIRYDYDSDTLEYVNKMYFSDPTELENVFLANDATARPMKILYVSSYAGYVQPPYYQTLYNERQFAVLQHVRSMRAALRYPNTEFLATLCTFTNTSAMDTSVNPSADAGDYAQQQFQAIFKVLLRTRGFPPALVGSAVVQATLLRAQLNYETMFDASGGYSVTSLVFYQLFM
jgi:NAD(P)-dependent dehydrogenase (short-subunit alcohol dehydrogenase family)